MSFRDVENGRITGRKDVVGCLLVGSVVGLDTWRCVCVVSLVLGD